MGSSPRPRLWGASSCLWDHSKVQTGALCASLSKDNGFVKSCRNLCLSDCGGKGWGRAMVWFLNYCWRPSRRQGISGCVVAEGSAPWSGPGAVKGRITNKGADTLAHYGQPMPRAVPNSRCLHLSASLQKVTNPSVSVAEKGNVPWSGLVPVWVCSCKRQVRWVDPGWALGAHQSHFITRPPQLDKGEKI